MINLSFNRNALIVAGISMFISSSQSYGQYKLSINGNQQEYTKAICVLYPTEGNHTKGIVQFTETDSGVLVIANVQGLSEGKHGFHIHEYGDCSASDGTTAGGHFSPQHMDHGAPSSMNRHSGDFGNITANNDSIAYLESLDKHISLKGQNSIIGRAVIVHANEDDLTSQPTGNAGARVACGVIGIAK